MRIGLFAFALLLSLSANAQTRVNNYAPGQNEEGVTYFLPQTVLHITVTAEKTTFVPGDFCRYAEKYLRLKGVSSKADEAWDIKDIEVTPVGEPNKEQAFTIELRDKTVAPLVELTPDGVLKAINTHSPQSNNPDESEVTQPAAPLINPRDYMTEEILMAGSTAKMAELTAKEIYNIRESKNALLRGEADNMPKDGEQLKLMLDNLNRQEKAMTEMFTGKTVEQSQTFTVRITPQEMQNAVISRFSTRLGVVDSNNLAGEPIYISITDLKTINIPPVDEKDQKKKIEGVAYNAPGKAKIEIKYKHQKLFEDELPVSQFGTTEYLAPVLFNKNSVTQVLFDTTTGGLLKVDRGE